MGTLKTPKEFITNPHWIQCNISLYSFPAHTFSFPIFLVIQHSQFTTIWHTVQPGLVNCLPLAAWSRTPKICPLVGEKHFTGIWVCVRLRRKDIMGSGVNEALITYAVRVEECVHVEICSLTLCLCTCTCLFTVDGSFTMPLTTHSEALHW